MNTIGTGTYSKVWRSKLREQILQKILHTSLVAEAVCEVDNSGAYYIDNPYGSSVTAAVTAIASGGTYSVSAFTTTEDSLAVSDVISYGEHVFNHEKVLSNVDLVASRAQEQAWSVADRIDHFVINKLTNGATGSYSTPAGGFTTSSNISRIFADLIGSVAGYAEATANGLFIILENTDVTGLIQSQIVSGYSYADAALRNGLLTNYAGVDIYVVRTGRFVTATIGSLSATNSGKRLFGVKKVATYAAPRNIEMMEKEVSGKTGREIAVSAYVGAKVWTQKAGLLVAITLIA